MLSSAALASAPSPPTDNEESILRAQLKAARAALKQALADQRRMERAATEAEQRRIAQLLHDTVSQSLTAAYLQAMVLAHSLKGADSGASADVTALADTLHAVVTELRGISRQLQPTGRAPS